MENSKKKFHITLTNNETGNVFDADSDCIIGSVVTGKGARSFSLCSCTSLELLKGIYAVLDAVEYLRKNDPDLCNIDDFFSMLDEVFLFECKEPTSL